MEGRECLWMFTPHQVKHRSVSFGVQSPLWSVEIRDGYVSSRDGVLQQPPCCCCYVALAGAGVLPPRFANSSAVLAWPVLALALCTVCSLIIEVWGLIWGVGGRVKPDTELRCFFFPIRQAWVYQESNGTNILCLKPEQRSGLSKVGLDQP